MYVCEMRLERVFGLIDPTPDIIPSSVSTCPLYENDKIT